MRIVSLFSGAGGLDWGFLKAGHQIVWANDNFEVAVETYKQNIGAHIVLKPIEKVKNSEIPSCDVVIGGFPCQGFSVANRKRTAKDKRNTLYLQFLRILKAKKPKYFLAENVKGLLSLEQGKVFEAMINDFSKAGYKVKHTVVNAADYGVPQKRERVIILGTRKTEDKEIDFPAPTHCSPGKANLNYLKPWISIGEALKGIPEPGNAANLPNHTCSKYKLIFNGHIGHRRIDPTKPAPTVTGRGDGRGGVVVLHHPKNHRRMSARELATAQSFPLDYNFYGSQSSAYRQIANAVPPKLALSLALSIPRD
ncbi:MAG: DNA cytosine methyltransferase [Candidatus ainarchaeum sp.]|nr:DNA cytosine methyltransferase [Candidatus ainarchaeum sp.]